MVNLGFIWKLFRLNTSRDQLNYAPNTLCAGMAGHDVDADGVQNTETKTKGQFQQQCSDSSNQMIDTEMSIRDYIHNNLGWQISCFVTVANGQNFKVGLTDEKGNVLSLKERTKLRFKELPDHKKVPTYGRGRGAGFFYVITRVNNNYDNMDYYDENDEYTWRNNKVVVPLTRYERVFVGESPKNKMTLYSGGYGRKWDGNTILFDIGNNKYLWIGEKIMEFETDVPIKFFVSPVGNSCVPYPYAVDERNIVYLLVENVKLTKYPFNLEEVWEEKYNTWFEAELAGHDPITYYYEQRKHIPLSEFGYDAKRYMYNEKMIETHEMEYHPCWTSKAPKTRFVQNGKDIGQLTDEQYTTLMKAIEDSKGFAPMKSKVIFDP